MMLLVLLCMNKLHKNTILLWFSLHADRGYGYFGRLATPHESLGTSYRPRHFDLDKYLAATELKCSPTTFSAFERPIISRSSQSR